MIMRDIVKSKSAPIGASSFSVRDIVKSKSAPIGAFIHSVISLYKIGTNWCLFILTVMRDSVISKSAPIGADLDLTISLRSTVRIKIKRHQNRHQLVPILI